jgi:hypothetical protein
MRLRDLRDIYFGHDIYIVGSGPSINIFPKEFLRDKICISLNASYKSSSFITPIAFMHHIVYSRKGNVIEDPIHPFFKNIKYPVIKGTGKTRKEKVDWDNDHYYFFDWNHDIEKIYQLTKNTDELFYTPEGCAMQAAMQLAWILGARNIFLIGCDSRVLGKKHYADFEMDGFRNMEILKRGNTRNYDSYVFGALIVMDFLKRKGINVFNLSNIVGYHMVDLQYDAINEKFPIKDVNEFLKDLSYVEKK